MASALYQEGLTQFRNTIKPQKDRDREILNSFLKERESPEGVKQTAVELKESADGKYEADLGPIPKEWIANILGNIDRAIDIGDFAAKGGPESVGMAWMVVKLTLGAIRENYELYNLFGVGLTTVTEIMTIIPHYDKLYDNRGKAGAATTAYMDNLFSNMRDAYSATLTFCYSVRKHIRARKRDMFGHAIKDFFGVERLEFQTRLDLMIDMKDKVIANSNGAFQKEVFEKFAGLGDVVQELKKDLQHVNSFAETSGLLRQGQEEMLSKLGESVKRLLARSDSNKDEVFRAIQSIKPQTPWEAAQSCYDQFIESINLPPDAHLGLDDTVDEKYGRKLIEDDEFFMWEMNPYGSILMLVGTEGSGKTIYTSALRTHLSKAKEADEIVLSMSIKKTEPSDRLASGLAYHLSTLVVQLFRHIHRVAQDDEDAVFLTECIEATRTPRPRQDIKCTQDTPRKDNDWDPINKKNGFFSLMTLSQVADVTKRRFRRMFLVIDGIDNLTPSEQIELAHQSWSVSESMARVFTLAACGPTSQFHDYLQGSIELRANCAVWRIDNTTDLTECLDNALDNIAGLSKDVREQAKLRILKKARSSFNYLTQVAIPHLRQPYQGSLLVHIDNLPETTNATYARFVQTLDPGSLELLRTALSLTLYAGEYMQVVQVEEMFDFFTNVYVEPYEEAPVGNLKTTDLQIEQLKNATRTFLEVYAQCPEPWVCLTDPEAIRSFCKPEPETFVDQDKSCARCRSMIRPEHSLAIDEANWHVNLALRCLQHLNSRLFHERFDLTRACGPDQESSRPKKGCATPSSVSELDGVTQESADSPLTSQTLKVPSALAQRSNGETPRDIGHQAAKIEVSTIQEPCYSAAKSIIEPPLQDDCAVDEDSIVDEDEDKRMSEGVPEMADELLDRPHSFLSTKRYEINTWYEHLYTAQKLWSKDRRLSDSRWQLIIQELGTFTTANRSVFDLCQQRILERYKIPIQAEPWKPLHVAALLGLTFWAEHLMEVHNADPRQLSCGRNALQAAAEGRADPHMLGLLLDKAVDPNLETSRAAAFNLAMTVSPHWGTVELFMRHGANPSIPATHGEKDHPLHSFMRNGTDPDALRSLVCPNDPKQKPDINARNANGEVALHVLFQRLKVPLDLLEALVCEYGACVDVEDNTSTRPLQLACLWGETEIVKVLLRNNEDVNDPDSAGRTAMHNAARTWYQDCIDILLTAGVHPHTVDHHGRTPLFYSCLRSRSDIALHIFEILQSRGMDGIEINKPTMYGQTPLRQAAARGMIDVVNIILRSLTPDSEHTRASINQSDTKYRRTALHQAVKNGHVDTVAALLDRYADTALRDRDGKTALDICREVLALGPSDAVEDIAVHLIKKSPVPAIQDSELAATAAIRGRVKILDCLQVAGADLLSSDRFGWKPLALARQFKQHDAENLLQRQNVWNSILPKRWSGGRDGTTLSGSGLVVSNAVKGRFCLTAERPLPPALERYYFEITLRRASEGSSVRQEEHSSFSIGFCTHDATQFSFPGLPPKHEADFARSWGYQGIDGCVYAKKSSSNYLTAEDEYSLLLREPSERYGPGDTVGAGFDSKESIIWFTRNGKYMAHSIEHVNGRMFPAIGVDDEIVVETNFGPDGFLWDGAWDPDGGPLEVFEDELKDESADEEVSESDETGE